MRKAQDTTYLYPANTREVGPLSGDLEGCGLAVGRKEVYFGVGASFSEMLY